MSKIYRLIIISIMAVIFAIGCSDTGSQSSGGGNITDNGSSGGNGGDGSGGDGSGSSSEIINSTMRASASQDNALLYTFFTPAAATNGASLKYSWDFDDNAVETTDNNIINHEFSKYGKSYNVTLEVSNMQTNDKENVSMIIPLPKPTIYFACSSAGLDIYCLPNISQQGIMDVEYTWNIYNSSEEQIASLNTTGSHELATYTLPVSGTYKIELIGRSEKVDGDLTYTENVEVSQSLNKGSISHSVLSADKLQYKLRYSAGSTNGDILNYCWEIDEEVGSGKCESDANYHQGTSSTYDEIMHTFPKYKKAYNIKGYVKDTSGAKPAVSSAIIYQDLPVVAVSATGAGLSKKFSPVFTYKPAGNLQYVWNFGDGAQSSAESPEHTYQKSGYYTINLEVISDKFDTSIGSIKSDDLNININEHITNVVIETSLKARDKSGEKYVITSPAQSTNGALYYIWKVDGAVVSEGENIHTLEHSFPIYGKSYSVSLEVEDKTTGTKVIAEPKVITTKKPIAKIVLPPYSTPNTQVQIQAKAYFEDTGEDFIIIADNPAYEWYINGQNENQNKPSIDKFFSQTQQVPVSLNINAENIEGGLLTANETIYINDLNLECSIADDTEDIYGAIVTCQIPTTIEGSTQYYYKFTYTEYMNGAPTVVEVPATEKTQFKMKLYEEDSPKRNTYRNDNFQWYAGTKGQYQYSGNINFEYRAKEPIMDRVVDISTVSAGDGISYILTEKGNVYFTDDEYSSTYKYSLAAPKYMYALTEPISKIIVHYYGGDSKYYTYFQAKSGNIYRTAGKWNEDIGVEQIKGVTGTLEHIIISNNIHYLATDSGLYMLGYYGDGSLVLNKQIKESFNADANINLILAEDGSAYYINKIKNGQLEALNPEIKFKKMQITKYQYSSFRGLFLISEDNNIYQVIYETDKQIIKPVSIEGIDLINDDITIMFISSSLALVNDKICNYNFSNYAFIPAEQYKNLSVKKCVYYDVENEKDSNKSDELGYFIITTNGELYVYGPKVKYGLLGLGHKNPVNQVEKVTAYSGVKNIEIIHSNGPIGDTKISRLYVESKLRYFVKFIVETENGTYEWGMEDSSGERVITPVKTEAPYHIISWGKYGMLTDIGLFMFEMDGNYNLDKVTKIEGFPAGSNPSDYKLYLYDTYYIGDPYYYYILVDGRLYTLKGSGYNPIQRYSLVHVNKEYFDSIGE